MATLLRSPAEVRLAARELRDRLGTDVHDFGLQPQLHQGPSLAVLGGRGTRWGPVVGLAPTEETGSHRPDGTGADGSPQDLPDARRPRWALAPVDAAEATALVRDLRMAYGRAGPVLWPAAALDALTAVLERVSMLLHDSGRSPRWSCGPSSSTETTRRWPPPGSVSTPSGPVTTRRCCAGCPAETCPLTPPMGH